MGGRGEGICLGVFSVHYRRERLGLASLAIQKIKDSLKKLKMVIIVPCSFLLDDVNKKDSVGEEVVSIWSVFDFYYCRSYQYPVYTKVL